MHTNLFFLIVLLFLSEKIIAQEVNDVHDRSTFRVMFYNVENLFDTKDDTAAKDEAYTPGGKNYWTPDRYKEKRNKIAKTIIAAGEWEPPEIVGICEVENQDVVKDLLNKTPLSGFDYSFLHKESPDWRGIDVALLFREKAFTPLDTQFLKVDFPGEDHHKTRDILYAKGIAINDDDQKDTLHLFVNHWPSRYGGQTTTAPKRVRAASILREKVDSLVKSEKNPRIIIMGDFNDEPHNKSLFETLNAKADTSQGNLLVNLMHPDGKSGIKGTYKYQYEWNILDQFVVSKPLLSQASGHSATFTDVQVFKNEFLLQNDDQYPGKQPHRTYLGPRYKGGYSDHLPIYLDLIFEKTP